MPKINDFFKTPMIKQHFGLKWDSKNQYYIYTSPDSESAADHIKTLAEISTLNREPDFFEVLKMAIKNGSLGQYAGYNMTYTQMDIDKSVDNHLIRIGANIIDQSDTDDIPTSIFTKFKDWVRSAYNGTAMTGSCYRSGNSEMINFGVENIPYPNELISVMHRPIPTLVNGYLQFELWNPHRAAPRSNSFLGYNGARIESFRLKGYQGEAKILGTVSVGGFIDGGITADQKDIEYQQTALTNSNSFSSPFSSFSSTTPLKFTLENQLQYREPSLINAPSGDIFGPFPVPGENIIKVHTQSLRSPGFSPSDNGNMTGWTMATFPINTRDYNIMIFRYGDQSDSPQKPITFQLECLVNNQWISCSRYEEIAPPSRPATKYETATENDLEEFWLFASFVDPNFHYGQWNNSGTLTLGSHKSRLTLSLIDPRTSRFSWNNSGNGTPGFSIRPFSDNVIRSPKDYGQIYNTYYWAVNNVKLPSWWQMGSLIGNSTAQTTGGNFYRSPGESSPTDLYYPSILSWTQSSRQEQPLALLGKNITTPIQGYQLSYSDSDGVVRPADYAYLPDIDFPTVIGAVNARPIILNRPFRNIGELGLVFRDIPFKSLDFFSNFSADLGLMDLFTIQENSVVSGLVDLSKIKPEIAQALMEESYNAPHFLTNGITDFSYFLTTNFLAGFQYKNSLSEVIKSYINQSSTSGAPKNPNKIYAESPVRALSSFADVDSKTYFMDIEVREDRLGHSKSSVFSTGVRNWVQFSIDRTTGSLVEIEWEPVFN